MTALKELQQKFKGRIQFVYATERPSKSPHSRELVIQNIKNTHFFLHNPKFV